MMMNVSTKGRRDWSAEGGGINWHMFIEDGENLLLASASRLNI